MATKKGDKYQPRTDNAQRDEEEKRQNLLRGNKSEPILTMNTQKYLERRETL
jgi:hypothetical protein